MRVQCLILLYFFLKMLFYKHSKKQQHNSKDNRKVWGRWETTVTVITILEWILLHYSYFVYSPFSSTRCIMKTFLNFTRLITKYELSRLSEWLESVVFINQAWKYQNQFLLYWFDKNLAPKHRRFSIVTFTTPGQFLCMHEGGKEWIFYIVIFIVISFYLLIYFFVF